MIATLAVNSSITIDLSANVPETSQSAHWQSSLTITMPELRFDGRVAVVTGAGGG